MQGGARAENLRTTLIALRVNAREGRGTGQAKKKRKNAAITSADIAQVLQCAQPKMELPAVVGSPVR